MRSLICAGALALLLFVAPSAQAGIPACTAADIVAAESVADCPDDGVSQCNITKDYDIANGCDLDFGSRDVFIETGSRIDVGSGAMTLRAADLTLDRGSDIRGRGEGSTSPTFDGGMVSLITSGGITMVGGSNKATIDVSANSLAGDIFIDAQGPVLIAGQLLANNLAIDGDAGTITVFSADFTLDSTGELSARNGNQSFSGGTIDILADGDAVIDGMIDLDGGDGGFLDLAATGQVSVDRDINTTGNGDAGSGGVVDILAGTDLFLRGRIVARGTTGLDNAGGDGGAVCVEALFGDVTVTHDILATAASSDGAGDTISITAAGSVHIASTAQLSARANGSFGCGGFLTIEADLDITAAGPVDVSGGFGGGEIDYVAGRHITIAKVHDAQGRAGGGIGGGVFMEAGASTFGRLSIQKQILADGGGCSFENGCGVGGSTDLSGCEVEIFGDGDVFARGADGGQNQVTAFGLLRILSPASLRANATTALGLDGSTTLDHADAVAPILSGSFDPLAEVRALPLQTCPQCGNNEIEVGETCDDGNVSSCDGCSFFCQVEDCDDSNFCTADTCDPQLGCGHTSAPDGTTCDDGFFCSVSDTCSSGVCNGTMRDCSSVGDQCNNGVCNPFIDACEKLPKANGVTCDDGNFCSEADRCFNGGCFPGSARDCSGSGDQCNDGVCNEGLDQCEGQPKGNGVPCSDGLFCTEGETCQTGVCIGGGARDCSEVADDCNTGSCDEIGDLCVPAPVSNGTLCDDGEFCSINDFCFNGLCVGPARDCGDGDNCTDDSCDEPGGVCVNTPTASCCGNGVPEGSEACDAGPANSDTPNAPCRTDCSLPRCGDEIIDDLAGEECDDGNLVDGDGCSQTCGLEGLDHYMFYKTRVSKDSAKFAKFGPIALMDQFRLANYDVQKNIDLGLPADKNGEGVTNAVTHLRRYQIKEAKNTPKLPKLSDIRIVNQCNDLFLETVKAESLLLPVNKEISPSGPFPPSPDPSNHGVDHYVCYKVKVQKRLLDGTPLAKFPKGTQVEVTDQFQSRRYDLKKITKLCNPVFKSEVPGSPPRLQSGANKGQIKNIAPAFIRRPDDHLVCYQAKLAKKVIPQQGCGCDTTLDPSCKGQTLEPAAFKHNSRLRVHLTDQFGQDRIDTTRETEFCIPSQKFLP